MRVRIVLPLLLAATAARGSVTFVAPQNGARAVGPQIVEVVTDAADVDRVEFYVDGVLVGAARSAPYRVACDFGMSLEARKVTAKVHSNGYRHVETAEITTAAFTAGEQVNVDLVEVPLRVESSRSVTPGDFRLRENSVEQHIRQILPSRATAHFSFVVDRSLSMNQGKLAAAVAAVEESVTRLRDGDTASVTLFNHHVSRPEEVRGRAAVASAFAGTPPSGGTSLRDAVAASMRPGLTRTYIIVITDGGDRNSLLSEQEAVRRISGTRSIVSAVILGRSSPFLERAAANTGGTVLRATTGSLRREVQRILDDINSRYTLVYQSNGTTPGWRSITLEPRRPGLSVLSARKGYFAE